MRGKGTVQRAALLCFVLLGGIRCGNAERNQPESRAGSPAMSAGRGGFDSGGNNSGDSGGAVTATKGGSAGSSTGGSAAGAGGGRATGGQPSPNDWRSDFPLGTPGWKQSSEPFCDLNRGRLGGASVWADQRGVFSLVSEECVRVGRDLPYCPEESRLASGMSLNFNDGTGWRVLLNSEYSILGLTGFEGGALMLWRPDCVAALLDVDSGTVSCTLPATSMSDPFVQRSFVVNESLAYLVDQAGLHEYRAGAWSLLADALPEAINALWANEEVVYLAGEFQLYAWDQKDSALHTLPDVPAAFYSAAWGFAADDVWFGNSSGQLTHYDGHTFRRGKIPSGIEYPGITALWGNSGELFFSMYDRFGRVTAALELETLIGAQVLGFWGTSPSEVFLAVGDSVYDDTACGAAFLLHFDGSAFHRF
jgi:hypothetical protein